MNTIPVPPTIRIDLTGKTFGRLTVLGYSRKRKNVHIWICQCSCGKVKEYVAGNLRGGHSTKCVDCANKSRRKGDRRKRQLLYKIWHTMNDRPKCWNEFQKFVDDVGDRPEGKYFRKKDRSKQHGPDNFIWSDKMDGGPKRLLTYKGETLTLTEWASKLGISKQAMHQRLSKNNMTKEELFSKRKATIMSKEATYTTSLCDDNGDVIPGTTQKIKFPKRCKSKDTLTELQCIGSKGHQGLCWAYDEFGAYCTWMKNKDRKNVGKFTIVASQANFGHSDYVNPGTRPTFASEAKVVSTEEPTEQFKKKNT